MRVLMVVCFAVLGVRLIGVQVLSGGRYSTLAAAEVTSTVSVPAVRGTIYDRDGAVLAVSVPTSTVVADPFLITHPAREANVLASVLSQPAGTITTELSQHAGYVVLASQVNEAVSQRVQALGLDGISLLPTTERVDPAGSLAAPLLGGVNASDAGDAGIEYQYNTLLRGRAGTEKLQSTPDDVPLPGGDGGTAPVPGTGIELTLDEQLQYVTEQALGAEVLASHAKSGMAVVMNSRTGDILAMANLVAVPATGAAASRASSGSATGTVPPRTVEQAPQDYALTKVYEPGSVFKLVTFSAALEAGLIEPQENFTIPNSINIDGWTFHDAENHPTEQLTATQILAQSSNIGTIEIASLLGRDRLAAQIAALGFGRPTGLDFPGESPGLVRSHPSQWSGSDMGSTPIGQDDAVTAQQVLDMVNTVATGGVFVPPLLVQATVMPGGGVRATAMESTHRVISSAVSATLTTMMEQVVQDGTAVAAAIPGYTVAGKTGTAQIPNNVQGGYIPGAYMATFAGFAPAQDPVLSAVVVLEQPTPIFGGTVAAPVFAQVMGYALHRYGVSPTQPTAPSGAVTAPLPLGTLASADGQGSPATIGAAPGPSTGTP
jgi:cell division protein FtsI (penicillin-binding protein 3)